MDRLSGGRFEFGVGAGWNREEMANHGTDPRTRMRLMAERIEAMKAIWTEDEASYHGEFVDFDRIWSWPKPAQRPHPPVLVGGIGPTVLDRVLRFGDAWFPNYGPTTSSSGSKELRSRAERPIDVMAMGAPAKASALEPLARGRLPARRALDPVGGPRCRRGGARTLGVGDRRADRRGVTDRREARERFAAARVARLATADAGGRPHLVPVVFVVQDDRVYSAVDAKPKRTTALRRLANVRENPAVALLTDHYEDDWDALWWARADGTGRVLEAEEAEARRAVALLRERYPQQRAVGAVLAVDVQRWSGWAAAER